MKRKKTNTGVWREKRKRKETRGTNNGTQEGVNKEKTRRREGAITERMRINHK